MLLLFSGTDNIDVGKYCLNECECGKTLPNNNFVKLPGRRKYSLRYYLNPI
jgi:hypothetical protein